LIVALIAVADALGVKLVPDFSNVVARQDGLPLEVETLDLDVHVLSARYSALLEERAHLRSLLGIISVNREPAVKKSIARLDGLLSVSDAHAAHLYTRMQRAAVSSARHSAGYAVLAEMMRR